MARLMARAGRDLLAGADAVVPVPLHRWRLWRRRYNQSGLLARHIGDIAGRPVRPDLLDRVQRATRQAGLDPKGESAMSRALSRCRTIVPE